MAISTQTQNLNLIPGKSAPVVVHLSQGNVGNTVQFYLYDGDNPYYPTNVSIAVHGVRADGSVFGPYVVRTTTGSNLVSFSVVSAMTSVSGAAIGELVLTDSNQNQIGTANFGVLVEKTPYSSSVTYEDDLSIYQRILAYVQSNSAATNSRINLLQTEIDQIIAPTGEAPSAAEVQNARVGADGVTYNTLGTAIRTQINKLFGPRTPTGSETSLMQMALNGVYYIEKAQVQNLTDLPSDCRRDQVSTLINITNGFAGGGFVTQYFYQINRRIWARIIDARYSATYSDWQRFDINYPIEVANSFNDNNFADGQFQNVSISYESEEGFYSYGKTEFQEYAKLHTSTLISKTYNVVKFTGAAWAEAPALVYFDSAQNKIGSYPASRPSDELTIYVDKIVTIPSNVSYIRIQNPKERRPAAPVPELYFSAGKAAKEALIAYELSGEVHDKHDMLYGKKLVTAGDSYTQAMFGDATYDGKNYGYYVAKRHNMSFINSGISGSIMALDKTYVADPENVDIDTRKPFSYQRYLQIPSDTDYLTIWFGINDREHTNLGTINDDTNETFYGAWNIVLRYYLTNRPFMKVGLIVTTGANESYRQAVRDVAAKWGYPVLDWVQDKGVPAFFQRDGMSEEAQALRREAFGYNEYSAHPNPKWHEYASTIYEDFLKSL